MKPNKIVKGALNVLTAVGIGAVIGIDVFDIGSDAVEEKRLKEMRVETRIRVPGKLFKRRVIVDGYGNVVEWL